MICSCLVIANFYFIFHYYRLTSISYLLGQENESWGCGYHGNDEYSFCSRSGKPYDLPRPRDEYTAGYTTGDIFGCYINFRSNIVFYTKNRINLGNQYLELKVIF